MAYRNLTLEQYALVREAAKKICTANNLKTIGDFKRIGNEVIDQLENGKLSYGDLLQPNIPFEIGLKEARK